MDGNDSLNMTTATLKRCKEQVLRPYWRLLMFVGICWNQSNKKRKMTVWIQQKVETQSPWWYYPQLNLKYDLDGVELSCNVHKGRLQDHSITVNTSKMIAHLGWKKKSVWCTELSMAKLICTPPASTILLNPSTTMTPSRYQTKTMEQLYIAHLIVTVPSLEVNDGVVFSLFLACSCVFHLASTL